MGPALMIAGVVLMAASCVVNLTEMIRGWRSRGKRSNRRVFAWGAGLLGAGIALALIGANLR